eukprot:365383-Chlamydomonas_euryale.AAC.6
MSPVLRPLGFARSLSSAPVPATCPSAASSGSRSREGQAMRAGSLFRNDGLRGCRHARENVRAHAAPTLLQRSPAHPYGGCQRSHEWSAEPRE